MVDSSERSGKRKFRKALIAKKNNLARNAEQAYSMRHRKTHERISDHNAVPGGLLMFNPEMSRRTQLMLIMG